MFNTKKQQQQQQVCDCETDGASCGGSGGSRSGSGGGGGDGDGGGGGGDGDGGGGGVYNQVFVEDSHEDLDHIEVIIQAAFSHSDLQSTAGSENVLTNSSPDAAGQQHESIELIKREHAATTGLGFGDLPNRGSTPTNMVRRWSQGLARFSKNKRSIRDKTIYRMPSRKIFEVDGKLLSATSVDPEAEIELLVQEIEQHEGLMQDNEIGKQNRLDILRSLPQSLSTKRLLKQKLSITIEQHTAEEDQRHSQWRHCYKFCMFILVKLWHLLCIICNGIEIWYDSLKTIEGHFGSNLSSYFKFLRWLFMLNLMLFICVFSFITFPQMLHGANKLVNNTESVEINETPTVEKLNLNRNEVWTVEVINNREIVAQQKSDWHFIDLLTGEGALKSTLLFYGSYTNETFAESTYSLPYAYYMTMLLLYLSTFVVISTSMARSYRTSFIATSGSTRSMYAQKVFCSWDFSISNRKAAELKHFGIYTELKEVLSEIGESKEKLTILWRIWILGTRAISHLLVAAIIVGCGIVIWILLKQFGEKFDTGWSKLLIVTAVNLTMLLIQLLLSWIAKLEDYRSPRRTLHVTLVRNFMLEFAFISVIVYFLLTRKYEMCWETSVGQEVYRLIVSDFIISLLIVPLFSGVRLFIIIGFWPKSGRPEFDISQKSLGLVYNQTLLWIGILFAPMLAAVMVLKMLLMFYINKAMLLYLCKSPRHVWRSAQTQTLYLVFTFLSLLGVILTLGYIMTQVPVSKTCGPFREYNYMFQIFIDGVLKLRQHVTLWSILMTLIRPAAIGGLLVIMAVMAYYLHAKSRAHCMTTKMLQEMLYLEVKDKEFLLTQITNITKNREWLCEEMEQHVLKPPVSNLASNTQSSLSSSSVASGSEECILRSRNV